MAKNNGIDVFWGGILSNSCVPLEMSLNWCSHNCYYCFANLNSPDRKADARQISNFFSELWSKGEADRYIRKTLAAHLARSGYPVVISNNVDPFANNNFRVALPIIEVMAEMGIPFTLQTKGGKGIEEAISLLGGKPIVWYISITSLNADILRKCEPGAPSPEERLALVQRLVCAGHKVNVGCNPIIPGWIDDPDSYVKEIKKAGAHGLWVQNLHLSKKQLENMSPGGKEALGNDAIEFGLHKSDRDKALYYALREASTKVDLEIYDNQQRERSNYFDIYRECYPKTFPLHQDFVNHCYDTKQAGAAIYWQEYRDFFSDRFPRGTWQLREHLRVIAGRSLLLGLHIPQRLTYERFLCHIWQSHRTVISPANIGCFAYAADRGASVDDWVRIVDDQQKPILIFRPEGTDGVAYTDLHSL